MWALGSCRVEQRPSRVGLVPTPQASAMQLVLGGGHPELVELIMGLIEPDPDKDPKEAQEQAMQGVLSWSSLNHTHRALFHHTHLKWWNKPGTLHL